MAGYSGSARVHPLILRRALHLDVAVGAEDDDLHALLGAALAALPPARSTPIAPYLAARLTDGYRLTLGGETLREAATPYEVLDALVGHLNLAAIEASRGRLLPHAAAVAAPDGRVVLLPGPSGSGKTTLTAELVGSGLAYLTDETLAVDPVTLGSRRTASR